MNTFCDEWGLLKTPEGRCEWILAQARRWGYDKELLQLLGIYLFKERTTDEQKLEIFNNFSEKFKKLSISQKTFLIWGFSGYMKQVCIDKDGFSEALSDMVKQLEELKDGKDIEK